MTLRNSYRCRIEDCHFRNVSHLYALNDGGEIGASGYNSNCARCHGLGGVSGVWGPPTVMYLTAIDTPKREQIRVQGVIYGLGAVALTAAHIRSGVLNAETALFSAVMLVPTALGMALGVRVQDGLDAARFRRATLVVLVVAGLNLVRRGLFA